MASLVAGEFWSLSEHAKQSGMRELADELNEAGYIILTKKYKRSANKKNKLTFQKNNH
jgi:hypothetical protein